jgi:hypothetical protein
MSAMEAPSNSFILANTQAMSLAALGSEHIIPVFAKDNERAISHYEFVHALLDAVQHVFHGENISPAEIRVSHPIQGRVPEAIHKKPSDLLDNEKTLYYERMMFNINIPSIQQRVGGKDLSLSIGGVKSYTLDRLSGKMCAQKFKVYIGFKVFVCSNLCVSADGCVVDLEATHADELFLKTVEIMESYSPGNLIDELQQYSDIHWSRSTFEQFVGETRVKLYDPNFPTKNWFGDTQLGHVAKGYFENEHFRHNADGTISLWNVYNLLTEANKSSYIDSYLDRTRTIPKLLQPWTEKLC